MISCIDGLTGFPEAIEGIFPKTEIQLCIVHQIRNSLKYIGSKDQKAFMTDLKRVYKAVNKELALSEMDRLEDVKNLRLSFGHGAITGRNFLNISNTPKRFVGLFTRLTLLRRYIDNSGN